jgi:hypothetical protein
VDILVVGGIGVVQVILVVEALPAAILVVKDIKVIKVTLDRPVE